jgi:hypothetical protein
VRGKSRWHRAWFQGILGQPRPRRQEGNRSFFLSWFRWLIHRICIQEYQQMEKDAVRLNAPLCDCLTDSYNRRQPGSINSSYFHVFNSPIHDGRKGIDGNRRKSNGEGEIGVNRRKSKKLYDNRKHSMGIGLYECSEHQNR